MTFHSDVPILEIHAILRRLCDVLSEEVNANMGQPLRYEATGINLVYDHMTTSFGPAAFSVQRREGVPFSDNKYYSAAPVKTQIHIGLIEELEHGFATRR